MLLLRLHSRYKPVLKASFPVRSLFIWLTIALVLKHFAKNDISLESETKMRKRPLYAPSRIFTQMYSNYGILFHQRK
jgi:hypothetical protein